MPALEMAQETGKLIRWLKREGDTIAKGEPVMEIETGLAKGSLDVEARRNPKNVYHKMTEQELAALTPAFAWPRYFEGVGTPLLRLARRIADLVAAGASREEIERERGRLDAALAVLAEGRRIVYLEDLRAAIGGIAWAYGFEPAIAVVVGGCGAFVLADRRNRGLDTALALLIVVGIASLMEIVGLSPALGTFLAVYVRGEGLTAVFALVALSACGGGSGAPGARSSRTTWVSLTR